MITELKFNNNNHYALISELYSILSPMFPELSLELKKKENRQYYILYQPFYQYKEMIVKMCITDNLLKVSYEYNNTSFTWKDIFDNEEVIDLTTENIRIKMKN